MAFETFKELMGTVRGGVVLYDNVCLAEAGAIADAAVTAANGRTASAPSLNRGGWKSSPGFLDQVPAARVLLATLQAQYLAPGVRIEGWAMVNRFGSRHERHQHRMVPLAGVYYATTGDPTVPTIFEMSGGPPEGALPKGVRCIPKKKGYEMEIDPIVGRVVLMAGDVWHRVPRYEGENPRVTVAFDVKQPR